MSRQRSGEPPPHSYSQLLIPCRVSEGQGHVWLTRPFVHPATSPSRTSDIILSPAHPPTPSPPATIKLQARSRLRSDYLYYMNVYLKRRDNPCRITVRSNILKELFLWKSTSFMRRTNIWIRYRFIKICDSKRLTVFSPFHVLVLILC